MFATASIAVHRLPKTFLIRRVNCLLTTTKRWLHLYTNVIHNALSGIFNNDLSYTEAWKLSISTLNFASLLTLMAGLMALFPLQVKPETLYGDDGFECSANFNSAYFSETLCPEKQNYSIRSYLRWKKNRLDEDSELTM